MLSLPTAAASPFAAPALLLGILALTLLTGAILVGMEMRAESRDRKRTY